MDAGNNETLDSTIREAVGVFHAWSSLQAAADDLLSHGFDRSEISLLANDKTVQAELGHVYREVAELEDDPKVPRTAYANRDSLIEARAGVIGVLAYIGGFAAMGAVVASGGSLGAAVLATVAAGGGGGLIGTLLARTLGRKRADDVQKQIDNGGLLLWVRVRDQAHEQAALDILKRHAAGDVHVHDLAVSSAPDEDPLAGLEPDPFLPRAKI